MNLFRLFFNLNYYMRSNSPIILFNISCYSMEMGKGGGVSFEPITSNHSPAKWLSVPFLSVFKNLQHLRFFHSPDFYYPIKVLVKRPRIESAKIKRRARASSRTSAFVHFLPFSSILWSWFTRRCTLIH